MAGESNNGQYLRLQEMGYIEPDNEEIDATWIDVDYYEMTKEEALEVIKKAQQNSGFLGSINKEDLKVLIKKFEHTPLSKLKRVELVEKLLTIPAIVEASLQVSTLEQEDVSLEKENEENDIPTNDVTPTKRVKRGRKRLTISPLGTSSSG